MPAAAAVLLCLVIGITDGDTLTVRCDAQDVAQNLKVRLAEIDAPEAKQPWGQRSHQAPADMCFGRRAEVHATGTDRNGRLVARVRCDGVDANVEQVSSGLAWVYDQYVVDRTLYGNQQQARDAQLGLWQDPAPMPPWLWRRDRKQAQQR
jgi:endonuclease YncB( thermonuclease family)